MVAERRRQVQELRQVRVRIRTAATVATVATATSAVTTAAVAAAAAVAAVATTTITLPAAPFAVAGPKFAFTGISPRVARRNAGGTAAAAVCSPAQPADALAAAAAAASAIATTAVAATAHATAARTAGRLLDARGARLPQLRESGAVRPAVHGTPPRMQLRGRRLALLPRRRRRRRSSCGHRL